MPTLGRLVRAGFHTWMLFLLPWGVGAMVGLVFDVAEVQETAETFATYFALFVLPMMLLQVVAISVKVARERRALRARGKTGFSAFVIALDTHVRVLTGRGIGLAYGSVTMVVLALSAKWAQFGVIAMTGLGLLYLFSTAATLVSAFSIRAFDDRVRRGRGAIAREMSPSVVDAGDPSEERFVLARVPVPPGFRLHIEESLPAGLGGETRFAVDRSVSRAEATLSAPLSKTSRGVYRLGPARIAYEDIFGLTRVAIAAEACAGLRVLPRLRAILFDKKPRASAHAEGPLSSLSRIATEDHYRTRAYTPGDDARRVHWKLSVNTGTLTIRVPESVPFAPRKVRIVLDTHLPDRLRDAAPLVSGLLDLAVEGWVALAHALLARGERVSLVACVPDEDGGLRVREINGKRGEERLWRSLGADAAWQHEWPLSRVLEAATKDDASCIVVSPGVSPFQAAAGAKTSFIVAEHPLDLPEREARSWVQRHLFFDYPVGAEDNRFEWRSLFAQKRGADVRGREVELARNSAAVATRGGTGELLLLKRRGPHLSLEHP